MTMTPEPIRIIVSQTLRVGSQKATYKQTNKQTTDYGTYQNHSEANLLHSSAPKKTSLS
jgi:hypothetical protein